MKEGTNCPRCRGEEHFYGNGQPQSQPLFDDPVENMEVGMR
jgi:hypothetical protein